MQKKMLIMKYKNKFKSRNILNFILFIICFTSIIITSSVITKANAISLQDEEPLEVRYYDRVKLHYYLSLDGYYDQDNITYITDEIVTAIYFKHEYNNGSDMNPNFEAHLYLAKVGQILRFTLTGVENQFPIDHSLHGEDLYYVVEILEIQKYSPEIPAQNPSPFDNLDPFFIIFVLLSIVIIGSSLFVYLKRKNEFIESTKFIAESTESHSEKITEIQQIIQDQKKARGIESEKRKKVKRR